jgi:Xaa-Pro aminopeptidase
MSDCAKGPFAVDWEERIDFARLRTDRVQAVKIEDVILVTEDESRVLSRVEYEERLLD